MILALESPEGVSLGEEGGFHLGDGDRDTSLGEEVIALALIAMVVGMKHPLDLFDACLSQVIEDVA